MPAKDIGEEGVVGCNIRSSATSKYAAGPRWRGGRVVHVSSSLHKNVAARDLLADPMCEASYGMFTAYVSLLTPPHIHLQIMSPR